MHRTAAALLSITLLRAAGGAAAAPAARPVDVVLCLDTSGSMESLLDSARSRLWDVVATLSRLEPEPVLRVGLVTYGSPAAAPAEAGWVVVRSDLTTDLDAVYGALIELDTEGGDEWVGQAIHVAVNELDWAGAADGLRLVFVAGNESVDQGRETRDFRDALGDARRSDVIVNALHAGTRERGVVELWDELARRGGGTYSSIDPVLATLQVETPEDALLLELNAQLNRTYLPFGPDGAAGLANQVAQDANATRLGVQSCSSRIVAKGTSLYDNSRWDLVDASLDGGFQWETLRAEDLPEDLRSLSVAELQAHVRALRERRESIQERIGAASARREAFLEDALRRARADLPGLDDALREALLTAARRKGFATDGC